MKSKVVKVRGCRVCGRKATYFAVVKGPSGEARVVETCGYHQKVTGRIWQP